MATKAEVIAAIDRQDERIAALRDRIRQHETTPLAEGEWRVRDALAHLAAYGNYAYRVFQRLEAVRSGTDQPAPSSAGLVDRNAAQIEERRDRSVEQLLEDLLEAHRSARAAVETAGEETLTLTLPRPDGSGEVAVGEMLMRGPAVHEAEHLDQIEAVIG